MIGATAGEAGSRFFILTSATIMFNFNYETVGKNRDIMTVVLSGTLDENNCSFISFIWSPSGLSTVMAGGVSIVNPTNY